MTTDTNIQDANLLLHSYVDGELDAANSLRLKHQIDANPHLAAEAASISALQRALREKIEPVQVTPSFRARIHSTIGLSRWRTPTSWRTLAASVMLAMAVSSVTTWLVVANADNTLLDNVIDSHSRALITGKPTDVASSDRHVVKPWFNDKLTSAPTVIDLRAEGYPLAGARVDVIGSEPVATLVFNRRLHTISLFELPVMGTPAEPVTQRSSKGLNVVRWRDSATQYWVVFDLNSSELNGFVDLFRKSVQ
jgi:anti-sigma factor RsiW